MPRPVTEALLLMLLLAAALVVAQAPVSVDVLIRAGKVLDGTGNPWVQHDVGISGEVIVFVGHAPSAGITGKEVIDAAGLLVTPGFWDVHSHADLDSENGRRALPQLYQGITTVVLGIDGGGVNTVREVFERYRKNGIAVNALRYVGQGAARRVVMGNADREPTAEELEQMKSYIARGMDEGAIGMSTGLFYAPGFFAKTEEVIELNKVAAKYGGIYDTHDRDLGAAYQSIGYDASVAEAIEIGEQAGTPVIFSHFGPQGAKNYGRAPAGAKLVDAARARGVNVMAGQHIYDATNSSLSAYAIPRWAVVGGDAEMRKRFQSEVTREKLMRAITAMIEIRGGAGKLIFTDRNPDLNGKTLADKAKEWRLSIPETVMRILSESPNVSVMNRNLYDIKNAEFLARQEWMMTCTDGGTPEFGRGIVHPRTYGSFSKKLRDFVLDRSVLSLAFAIRGMTGLAAEFLGVQNRGLIKEGLKADVLVLDESRIRDRATYDQPHQYSEGTVHVLVNGRFAIRDGKPTGELAGQPVPRRGTRAAEYDQIVR
jgi:N-acyl-D-amino-acid deacylase